MSEVIMFNKNDLAYFILPIGDRSNIERMKENGFIQNPRLVAIYHEIMNDHKMVPVQELKTWEDKGYYAEPTMIYSPTEPTRMVSSAEAKKACNNGWYLSPAHFPQNNRSDGKLKLGANKEAA